MSAMNMLTALKIYKHWPLTLILLMAPFIHWSAYGSAELVEDDLLHLSHVGSLETGRLHWNEYIWLPHNEHLLPAWRCWYWLQWKICGVAPAAWHIVILLAHGIGAVVVWRWLLSCRIDPRCAWFGAWLWSAASIGHWENPLIWVAASHWVFSATLMLAGGWQIGHYFQSDSRRHLAGGGICLSLAMLFMGPTAAIAVIIGVFAIFVTLQRQCPKASARIAVTALVPCGIMLFAEWRLSRQQPDLLPAERHHLGRMVEAVYTAALQNLSPSEQLTPLVVWGGWIAVLIACWSQLRSWCWWSILVICVGITSLVCLGRSEFRLHSIVNAGRYLYWPTLTWCVAVGLAMDGLLRLAALALERRWLADWLTYIFIGSVMLVHANTQYGRAVAARVEHEEVNADGQSELIANRDLVEELASDGDRCVALNMPIYQRPECLSLREFLAVITPGNRLTCLDIDQISTEALDAFCARLARSKNPNADVWRADALVTKSVYKVLTQIASRENERPLLLPAEISIDFENMSIALGDWMKRYHPRNVPGLLVLADGEWTTQMLMACHQRLVGLEGSLAQRWATEFFDELQRLQGAAGP